MRVISILDVGHGSSAVVFGEHATVVVDAGPGADLLLFLEQQNVSVVEKVIISHSDQDHLKGLVALLASQLVEVRCVLLNSDSAKNSQLWKDVAYEIEMLRRDQCIDLRIGIVEGDEIFAEENGVSIKALSPDGEMAIVGAGGELQGGSRLTSNSISAVLHVSFREQSLAILAADADMIALQRMSAYRPLVSAEVFVFPHHGGLPGRGNVAEFAALVSQVMRGRYVVFSNGRNKHNNPRSEVLKAVLESDPSAEFMCTQLSAQCNPGALHSVPLLTDEYANGRHANSCCSGTISVWVSDEGVKVEPFTRNQDFVRTLSSPKCRAARGEPR